MCPERTIIETGQTGIERVDGVVPTITQPARQDRGELVVDQKPHATSTTTWLVCRATYAIAVKMSSRSRQG